MSITVEDLQGLPDHARVLTGRGEKVGLVGQIYVDDLSGAPDWVTVRTGLFGGAETFVPLDDARLDGGDLVVAYAKGLIADAPRVDVDGSLSPQEEQVLYRHYSLGDDTDGDTVPGAAGGRSERSGTTTDAAMTRSEERLVVGTQEREAGRARLRKYVVTERVTQTVPVRHEEVRVTREPITATERDAVPAGATFREESYEVVLHAETPTVDKTVVPVERVRLDTVTVARQQTVSAEIRKEQVELDDPTGTSDHTTGTPTGTHDDRAGAAKGAPDTAKAPSKAKKGTRRRR